ncbi:response regulator [Vibrio sp. 404]|uniref:Sensory/regulatory protein RpfC n=1 Tax=Vibrio marinisediminis TaxID=2758441 RepID=A0A7W2FP50_9VIBR|nr:ATP-binding protein [Vibrio marinisediminis]MBA5761684.1 response regulator [Vibrio marinisediminis]
MTLRSKTIIGIALIEALALGVLIISGLSWLKTSNEQSLEIGSQQLVSVFAKASRDAVIATDLAYLDSFAQSVVSEHNLAYIRISDRSGVELTRQGDYQGVDTAIRPFDVPDGIFDVATPILLGEQSFGLVEMGVRVDEIHQLFSYAKQASIFIAVIEMSLVALFSFALGSYLLKRLDLLRRGVVRVTEQGPGTQIEISGNDEVTRVGDAFNLMSTSLAQAQDNLEQQYRTQKLLSDKVSLLAEVAEHARDTVIITDSDGKIVWVNSAFEQLTEYSYEEAMGKNPGALLQGDESDRKAIALLSESIRKQQPTRVEIVNYTKSGNKYWVELDLFPVFDESDQLLRFVAVERDITDRRKIEQQLSAAVEKSNKAAKAKSEFLANMSHEIRTPMNAILGISELLLENENKAEQKGLLSLLHKSAGNLVTVINDILDYSKVEAGKLSLVEEAFDLRELIENCTSLCAYQATHKNLLLLVDMPLTINCAVIGDKGRINQILLNLIGNALKFTESGHVLLKVAESNQNSRQLYQFDVIDTGIGIPADRLPHVMEKFEQVDNSVTRRYEGTGLGLAISKRLIQMYGGELTVTSTVGVGSCFSFCLELKQQAEMEYHSTTLEGVHILLVDDYLPRVKQLHRIAQQICLRITHVTSETIKHAQDIDNGARYDRIIIGDCDSKAYEVIDKLSQRMTKAESAVVLLEPIMMERERDKTVDGKHCISQPVTHKKLLDCFQAHHQREGNEKEKVGSNFSGVNLLVAEDSRVNRILISKMLEDTGVNLILAEDGEVAMALYQRTAPDLVITDISMPNKDGFSLTQDIRELQKSNGYSWCPVVAFSAHALQEEQDKSIEVGMDDYLTKPVKKEDLLNMISKWTLGNRISQ